MTPIFIPVIVLVLVVALIARLHIVPELGTIRLNKLTAQRVQTFLSKKCQSLAPATVRSLRVLLVSALTKSYEFDLIAKNVAKFSSVPHLPKSKVDPFTADEAKHFLAAVKGEPLEALFVLATTAGCRKGELLGLTWDNVDLVKGELQIRQALQHVRREAAARSDKVRVRSKLQAHRARYQCIRETS
jgi:integrase